MFTGIIRHVGQILSVRRASDVVRLTIDTGPLGPKLSLGDSLAVNGVCLTASDCQAAVVGFDVIAQTCRTTTLGSLTAGTKVNLEPALRLGDSLDGHMVQGHVDGVAEVSDIGRTGEYVVRFSAVADMTKQMVQMVKRGSIAIDGVSLTLVDVASGSFSVALIPTTLSETTLSGLKVGMKVNIETDIIGKYVHRYLGQSQADYGGGLTLEKLKQTGFASND